MQQMFCSPLMKVCKYLIVNNFPHITTTTQIRLLVCYVLQQIWCLNNQISNKVFKNMPQNNTILKNVPITFNNKKSNKHLSSSLTNNNDDIVHCNKNIKNVIHAILWQELQWPRFVIMAFVNVRALYCVESYNTFWHHYVKEMLSNMVGVCVCEFC